MEDEVEEFINNLTHSYTAMVEEVLSNCDSVIERKLFLFLTQQVIDWKKTVPGSLVFDVDYEFTNARNDLYQFPNHKPNRFKELQKFRYSGITLVLEVFHSIDKKPEEWYAECLTITPQFHVPYEKEDIIGDGKYYLLDIALMVTRKYPGGRRNNVTKICIECDGHAYHSSPEQKQSDNIRARKITSLGWKVLRYSGREIYQIDERSGKMLWQEVQSILDAT